MNQDTDTDTDNDLIPIPEEEQEDKVAVLYNTCYGGFDISKKATAEYNKRNIRQNPNAKPPLFWFERTDKILFQIYKEMRTEEFNEIYSKIRATYIPKKYENHYVINEYDGKETVTIDYSTYALDEIKKIIDQRGMTNDEKIKKINDFYLQYKNINKT